MSELAQLRIAKDQFFAKHPQSPLTHNQRKTFKGLEYFPENPALRLEIPVTPLDDDRPFMMQTSTGDLQTYRRFGRILFKVEDQPVELTIYSSEHGLFLPFADSLAGTETYGAGRYLEPESLPGGRLLVDFNLAYNPYCAYNDRWSCPLTPAENRLKVPVRAGEKVFPEHE